eukprot:TRINITY_DN9462_c0_g1_i1.p1 TRINITY_DN9462_c0_g1~~TRINITY_DN9462_c0_g1_i1.p1  ORF type:complete len:119 (+),score=2.38 TRINITY_DN9462_c0_g1_i1:282-638(+)
MKILAQKVSNYIKPEKKKQRGLGEEAGSELLQLGNELFLKKGVFSFFFSLFSLVPYFSSVPPPPLFFSVFFLHNNLPLLFPPFSSFLIDSFNKSTSPRLALRKEQFALFFFPAYFHLY